MGVTFTVGCASALVAQQLSQPKQELRNGADLVDPVVRSRRDAFFDSQIGAAGPLDVDGPVRTTFVWEQLAAIPELPKTDVVAVVTVAGYQPILSKSKYSLYTESALTVENLLKAHDALDHPRELSLLLPGGSIITQGKTIRYRSLETPYALQVGQRYAVFLRFISNGAFYMLEKSWLLNQHVVAPNSPDDV